MTIFKISKIKELRLIKKNTDKETLKISVVKIFRNDQDKPNELMYKNFYGEQDFKVVFLTSSIKTTRSNSSESGNQKLHLQKVYTAKKGTTD